MQMLNLDVAAFSKKIADANVRILDVRTPAEFFDGHIEGASNIDFYSDTFQSNIESLDRHKMYALYCRSGKRSGIAMKMMLDAGFGNVSHLEGGIIAWAEANMSRTNP